MRTVVRLLSVAAIMAAGIAPSFAMDMMKKGESMMIMSDGSMMTMNSNAADAMKMSAMMKPMKKCAVIMMGSDGKMYMMQSTDKKCSDMGKM